MLFGGGSSLTNSTNFENQNKKNKFYDLIIQAYKAKRISNFKYLIAKKLNTFIAIGSFTTPTNDTYINQVINECIENNIPSVEILSFEYQYGVNPEHIEKARKKGVTLNLKYIPQDVFNKHGLDSEQVEFYDVSYIDAKVRHKKHEDKSKTYLFVELKKFSVYYNQDIIDNLQKRTKSNEKEKLKLINGCIYRITKDSNSKTKKVRLTVSPFDWIDYWAVDFNYENKKEFITLKKSNKLVKHFTGSYIFENEWQCFRTKKDNKIETTSAEYLCSNRKRKVAIKVVDIFGNDSVKVIDVNKKIK